jgi:hypothetical protein
VWQGQASVNEQAKAPADKGECKVKPKLIVMPVEKPN